MIESPFRLKPARTEAEQAAEAQPAPIKQWPLKKASQLTPKTVEWLWYPYIPSGKITSLEGDPEMGKSWIICAIAASVTTGRPLPGTTQRLPPQNVLMLSGEDGLEDTLVPRLIAMGADLDRVVFPSQVFTLDAEGVRSLREAMKRVTATVCFIDPVQLFFGAKRDMNKANDVREMMGALHEAAEDCGCAVIIVRHKRKASSSNALYSGLGSIDFVASVRSALHVYKTKQGTRILEHIKCNLAAHGPSITYGIEDNKFHWGDMLDPETPVPRGALASDAAEAWLRKELAKGGRPATELTAQAIADGLKQGTLIRAKMHICRSYKSGDQWFWELKDWKAEPAEEPVPAAEPAEPPAEQAAEPSPPLTLKERAASLLQELDFGEN